MVAFTRRGGSSSGERQILSIQKKIFTIFAIVLISLFLCALRLRASLAEQYSVSSSPKDIAKTKIVSTEIKSSVYSNRPIQVAYAISLIKCSDKQSSTSGLIDAATVLRHSVHQTSVRNPNSGSKYDYKMYAIVHKKAESCSHLLGDLGYHIIVKDSPVQTSEIRGDYLRKNVHKEWCCGADEFVKLYAYTIHDHPIVVHTDIDFMYAQPMDDLFDAMLLPHDSDEGKAARGKVELEYQDKRQSMPEDIQAYLTRDYHQVIPGRKAAFQAGFIVLRPNQKVFEKYLEVIREGNYVEGFSRENGWGGKGYGGVVGSMAMQGLPAYYYDEIAPNTSVELNGCRYNHMGANIFYDNVPNFIRKYKDLHGKCRRNVEGCEDCRKTDMSLIKNIHFTNCRKPWNCSGCKEVAEQCTGKNDHIDPRTADYDHCMEVARTWHEMRNDLEQKIVALTGNDKVLSEGQKGTYKKDVFMGHCDADGQIGYVPIAVSKEDVAITVKNIWKESK
mmetsp:Transcript_6430/g.10458  ORF Transcript_6430/g.10458 Transcript_6430/m.10458 type:complete len:502 (-) Transcript_6430:2036-3541(-)